MTTYNTQTKDNRAALVPEIVLIAEHQDSPIRIPLSRR
jgi:hypothetical protein